MRTREKPTGMDADGQSQAPKAKVLRRDQVLAVEETAKALKSADRCQVIMPCGTGKTIVALRLSETVCPNGLTVVAVPTITLLAQTLAAWREDASPERRFAHLAVCSDPTVGRRSSGGDQIRDAMETLKCGAGIGNVTTEPVDIEKWLSKTDSAPRVVFVTHASVGRVADALRDNKEKADLPVRRLPPRDALRPFGQGARYRGRGLLPPGRGHEDDARASRDPRRDCVRTLATALTVHLGPGPEHAHRRRHRRRHSARSKRARLCRSEGAVLVECSGSALGQRGPAPSPW